MTGRERRRINPQKGLIKVFEHNLDVIVSRFLYPRLSRIWNPYSWLLDRRFVLTEAAVSPEGWPGGLAPLRVLLVSDIHTGIFLRPETLEHTVHALMTLEPFSRAPLGAWYSHGNHDYFSGDPGEIRKDLASIGITTLRNDAVEIAHGGGRMVLGALDDLLCGQPDWRSMALPHGVPHLLLAHNPDHFHEAASHGVPLTLSGHTHGGQIRMPGGPPIIRHSRFCLDEGLYKLHSSLLVVTRGLGSVGLPWRWGADPEAILLEITPQP